MLILTRRIRESVMIGKDVTVTVLGIKGNQAKLGVNAPLNIRVDREEVRERIDRENREQGSESPVLREHAMK